MNPKPKALNPAKLHRNYEVILRLILLVLQAPRQAPRSGSSLGLVDAEDLEVGAVLRAFGL